MKSLEQLPAVAQETLGGLIAGQDLLQRVSSRGRERRPALRRALAVPASFALLAAVLVIVLTLPGARREKSPAAPQINTLAAGLPSDNAKVSAFDVPRGSIVLSEADRSPSDAGVWASGSGANFPLIRIRGRYYRLLTGQPAVDRSRLVSLGQVEKFTDEPALDVSGASVSNAAAAGTPVFEIPGMQGAAVCAEVGGEMRVFQRVSFAGTALVGNEGLSSTLPGASVTGLQLSGVGTVTDAARAQGLMALLLNAAAYQGSASASTGQALLIQYGNGLVLQMSVKGNRLMACGTWSCPEFFTAFSQAVK